MYSPLFREGSPHDLIAPMYEAGYAIRTGLVDPEFTVALLQELKDNRKYEEGHARDGEGPGIFHDGNILASLGHMPRLAEYHGALTEAINDVSGYRRDHLTYLTTRVCPVKAMSTRIHRNDKRGGPWLATLTMAGSGSVNVYQDNVIEPGKELTLQGDGSDPNPLSASVMGVGDGWGIYSGDWNPPHAGGLNTSDEPKVLLLLYGWMARDEYPSRGEQPAAPSPSIEVPAQYVKPVRYQALPAPEAKRSRFPRLPLFHS